MPLDLHLSSTTQVGLAIIRLLNRPLPHIPLLQRKPPTPRKCHGVTVLLVPFHDSALLLGSEIKFLMRPIQSHMTWLPHQPSLPCFPSPILHCLLLPLVIHQISVQAHSSERYPRTPRTSLEPPLSCSIKSRDFIAWCLSQAVIQSCVPFPLCLSPTLQCMIQ